MSKRVVEQNLFLVKVKKLPVSHKDPVYPVRHVQ